MKLLIGIATHVVDQVHGVEVEVQELKVMKPKGTFILESFEGNRLRPEMA
jgi:hypothetical protein